MDVEKCQVPSEDVAFIFVSKTTKSEVVNYDPWTVTGSELLQVFSSSDTPDWLADLDLSRLSRQFINGMSFGRNSFTSKLTSQQLSEIQQRISVIKLSDEFLVDDDVN